MATDSTPIEEDKFADVRNLAQTNYDADVKATDALVVPEDTSVVTEIPAHPELEESANPEQVDTSSEFVESTFNMNDEQPAVAETPTETPVVTETPTETPTA